MASSFFKAPYIPPYLFTFPSSVHNDPWPLWTYSLPPHSHQGTEKMTPSTSCQAGRTSLRNQKSSWTSLCPIAKYLGWTDPRLNSISSSCPKSFCLDSLWRSEISSGILSLSPTNPLSFGMSQPSWGSWVGQGPKDQDTEALLWKPPLWSWCPQQPFKLWGIFLVWGPRVESKLLKWSFPGSGAYAMALSVTLMTNWKAKANAWVFPFPFFLLSHPFP